MRKGVAGKFTVWMAIGLMILMGFVGLVVMPRLASGQTVVEAPTVSIVAEGGARWTCYLPGADGAETIVYEGAVRRTAERECLNYSLANGNVTLYFRDDSIYRVETTAGVTSWVPQTPCLWDERLEADDPVCAPPEQAHPNLTHYEDTVEEVGLDFLSQANVDSLWLLFDVFLPEQIDRGDWAFWFNDETYYWGCVRDRESDYRYVLRLDAQKVRAAQTIGDVAVALNVLEGDELAQALATCWPG